MKFTQEALSATIDQDDTGSIGSNSGGTDSTTADENSPLFLALKGYKLFKHHVKLEAIVDFLNLSSFDPIFTSGDYNNIVRMDAMCEGPRMILRGLKGTSKYPSKWNSTFCARFIINAVELMEKDMKMGESNIAARKSPRKKSNPTSSLPPAAAALFVMVQEARVKAQHEHTTSKKRKTGKTKSVQELLLKNTAHNPEFVEVTAEMILDDLLCPICNHRSLVSVTTKDEADRANELIMQSFELKLHEWNLKGRKGQRPRMGKTESQVLGCVCYMQNCIGNTDGSGCFKCKQLDGNVSPHIDKG